MALESNANSSPPSPTRPSHRFSSHIPTSTSSPKRRSIYRAPSSDDGAFNRRSALYLKSRSMSGLSDFGVNSEIELDQIAKEISSDPESKCTHVTTVVKEESELLPYRSSANRSQQSSIQCTATDPQVPSESSGSIPTRSNLSRASSSYTRFRRPIPASSPFSQEVALAAPYYLPHTKNRALTPNSRSSLSNDLSDEGYDHIVSMTCSPDTSPAAPVSSTCTPSPYTPTRTQSSSSISHRQHSSGFPFPFMPISSSGHPVLSRNMTAPTSFRLPHSTPPTAHTRSVRTSSSLGTISSTISCDSSTSSLVQQQTSSSLLRSEPDHGHRPPMRNRSVVSFDLTPRYS